MPDRAALLLRRDGIAADEVATLEVDHPAEAELQRRRLARFEHHLLRAEVVDAEQHEARFDAGHVERVERRGLDAMRLSSFHQRVPHRQRLLALDPNLVAEVAGVAGAADPDGNPTDLR